MAAADDAFKAGVATKEFTVPAGTVMPNFPLRVEGERVPRVAEGTHDPLMVKTVVLEDGDTLLLLTSYDVVDAFESVTSRVRDLVAAELPIQPQNLLLSVTHTHQGPMLKPSGKDRWGRPVDSGLFESVVQAVSATIIEAYRQRKPASIGAGRGFIELNRNRRFIHRADLRRCRRLGRNGTDGQGAG